MKTIEAINAPELANKRITPGAGVDPKKVIRVSKRVRNLHRQDTKRRPMPLKQWVWEQFEGLSMTGARGQALTSSVYGRWLQSRGYNMDDLQPGAS